VYLEATGHPAAVQQGLNLLRKLGTYVEYSVFGSEATVDWTIKADYMIYSCPGMTSVSA
jgi:erythritol/L-threitol dehydrogenase